MDTGSGSPVERAFAAAPRELFLPEQAVRFAELDRPIPIGHGQTNSQPTTVRHLLGLLEASPGHRVLDVGCGSGWTTALLAHLVGPTGSVLGVEIVPELVAFGRSNLERADVPWARIEQADPDELGCSAKGPYDRILVSAEATDVPEGLVRQLAPDGRMVVPVDGRLAVVRRHGDDPEPDVRLWGHYLFVPLVEPARPDPGAGEGQ